MRLLEEFPKARAWLSFSCKVSVFGRPTSRLISVILANESKIAKIVLANN